MKLLTDLGITYEQARKYIRENICTECKGTLHISNGQYYGIDDYIIKCIRSKEHSTFGRPYKEPGAGDNRANKIRRLIELEKEGNKQTQALATLYSGVMTESKAKEIILAIWPGAPEIEVKKASILCATEGWNPLKKHVYLVPYKNGTRAAEAKCTCKGYPCPHPSVYDWSILIGIGAKRLSAQRKGDFSYIDNTPRVMSPEEQQVIFGEKYTDRIVSIVKLKNMITGAVSVGYGHYLKSETPKGLDKGNTRANMSFIRAEGQALDRQGEGKAATAGLEVTDERFMELPETVSKVNISTGEIIESTAKVLEPAEPPAENLGTCPIPGHEGQQIVQLNFKGGYNTTGHQIEGETTASGKPKYCTADNVEKWRQTAQKPPDESGALNPPPEQGQTLEKAPAKEISEAKPLDEPGLSFDARVRELAEAIWGDKFTPKFNTFLSNNFGFPDLRSIKVARREEIIAKLTEMIAMK